MPRVPAVAVDGRELLRAELDAPAVVDVRHPSPGRVALEVHWSRGTHSSGVRFWNLTASAPASTAPSMSFLASSSDPLWLMPDLGDDEHGLTLADPAVPHAYARSGHRSCASLSQHRNRNSHSANSRKAPMPPLARHR